LNDCKPNEITHATEIYIYFKCPRKIHKSEKIKISNIIGDSNTNIICKQCNSFAQWGIDNIGDNFLNDYWDYDKNININPWLISYGSSKKSIYIKCQDKDYHESYPTTSNNFTGDKRCPYCNSFASGKVHPLDSLGKLLEDKGLLHLWSSKNKKSPYEYAPHSSKDAYWKCPEGKHVDFKRKISYSILRDFRCPDCQYSKGEEAISNYFIHKNFIKIDQDDFNKLIDENKCNNLYYIPQMKYSGLVGLKGGLLSYDFYIPRLNLLIEYHGGQHEKFTRGIHKTMKDFERQLEHDNRKCIYADKNNINLLVIWYWDFDRIEKILERELSKLI